MNTINKFGYRILRGLICAATLLLVFVNTAAAQAENDSIANSGKAEASIELSYTEANNKTKMLEAIVKTKVEGSWQGVEGVTIQFYRDEADPEKLLGAVATNAKGIAILTLNGKGEETQNEYTFVAAVANSDKVEDSEETVTIAESDFEMTLTEEDSLRQIHISLKGFDEKGNEIPAGEVEVTLYVQRLFGLLPLSDDPETTDEAGEVAADFPTDIPGDTAGNVIIVARVDDHERFGNLEFRRKINWGVPVVIDPAKKERELWSSRSNAPIYLIVIVNAMLIGIWGVILYIVYMAFKIRKIGRDGATVPHPTK